MDRPHSYHGDILEITKIGIPPIGRQTPPDNAARGSQATASVA